MLRLPTSNLYANGDYTVTLLFGSAAKPLRLILDTGSSSLAIHSTDYSPDTDQHMQPTTLVQEVLYGMGGWAGPVIQTSVQLHAATPLSIQQNYVAITCEGAPPFAKADGILGLAYNKLNRVSDVSHYLNAQQPPSANSYPWPFSSAGHSLSTIQKMLQNYPKHNLTPWFTNLEQHGIIANCFAIYCRRSSTHFGLPDADACANDPLNSGWFVLGGGAEHTDLYQGEFQTIAVKHDIYYNIQLLAVQVAGCAPISCVSNESRDCAISSDGANGFVDTGASVILLPQDIYQRLLADIGSIKPELVPIIEQIPVFNGQEQGLPAELIDIEQWPDILFHFAGDNDDTVVLSCPAQDYWQVNAPQHGLSSFKIIPQLAHFASQYIIGLPLLCNYYTVFDRAIHRNGVIRVALARR